MSEYILGSTAVFGEIDDQEQIPESVEVLSARLDAARSDWARISAKRHGRLSDYNRNGELRAIHGYNQAQETYNELVIEYARRSMGDQLAALDNPTERNALAIGYVVDMQNRLNEEIEAIRDRNILRRIGRTAGEWLNTGGRYAKIAKSMGITVVASLLGGKIGGAVAGGTTRFVRAYYSGDVGGLEDIDTDEFHARLTKDADPDVPIHFDMTLQRAQALAAREFDAAGLDQQAKKVAGIRRGLGAAATGFVIGGIIGAVVEPVAHATPDFFPATEAHATGLDTVDHGSNLPVDMANSHGDNLPLVADTAHGSNLSLDASPVHGDNLPIQADFGHGDNLPIDAGTAHGDNLPLAADYSHGDNLPLESAPAHGDNLPLATNATHGDNLPLAPDTVHGDNLPLEGGDSHGDNLPLGGNDTHGDNLPLAPDSTHGDNLPLVPDTAHGDNLPLEADHGAVMGDKSMEFGNNLPAIDKGEGINSFVADNYHYHLTPAQSEALGHELRDAGYAYKSDYLQHMYGNPYGLSHPGHVDTGVDAIVRDMTADGHLDVDYHFSPTDWANIENMLDKAGTHGTLSELAAHDHVLMDEIGPALQGIHDQSGLEVVAQDGYGHWTFTDTTHQLPQQALDVIYQQLNTHHGATEKMLQLTRVI